MKKLLSALLIATLLVASVACIFAVAEEGDTATDPVVYNFLAAMEDTDNDSYKVVNNADGSVSVTSKDGAAITLVEAFDDVLDLNNQLYIAIDLKVEGEGEFNFKFEYTRADKDPATAQLYWDSMRNVEASIVSKTDNSVVWDLNAYITGAKLFENKQHSFKQLVFETIAAGQTVTFNTLAIVSDPKAMTEGTPLVAPKADDTTTEETTEETTEDNTTEDATTEDNTTEDATTEEPTPSASSSSDAPDTGDNGMIVLAVLAVVALAGGFVVVRARG